MNSINKQLKLNKWAQDMSDQMSSNLSRKQWCEIKGIPTSTYDYRCKVVKLALEEKMKETSDANAPIVASNNIEPVQSEPTFAKVNLQAPTIVSSGICIKLANAEVSIAPDTPTEHIHMVMEALAYVK